MEPLGDYKRTNFCGELHSRHQGQTVTLLGWVNRRRDHGGVIFIDLRDREGLVQVVFNPSHNAELHQKAEKLRPEYVLAVTGLVRPRPADMVNPKLATGEVEVLAAGLAILNASQTPPLAVNEDNKEGEEQRLKYRYLDLRRPWVQQNFFFRHRVCQATRNYLSGQGFIEVETPILMKSTPEGARDFLVPSRLNRGTFYALPQSPQLYKQLLMVAGFDRYFQIAKCFRDEDLRSDRQPEFTQIDCELSFVQPEDIYRIFEGLVQHLFQELLQYQVTLPLPRLTYETALEKYGSDKPDLRFGLEMADVAAALRDCPFKVFSETLASGGRIKAITATGRAGLSRKEIDELTAFVNKLGAKGLVWMRCTAAGLESQVNKFLSPENLRGLQQISGAQPGDMLFIIAGEAKTVNLALGQLRLELARRAGLLKPGQFSLAWVTDFPLFEYSETDQAWTPTHHPFTAPQDGDLARLDGPEYYKAKAQAYDIVLNGNEIGGGSIRIHQPQVQSRIFQLLGISEEEAQQKFGFLLEAFQYGAPPHGGIAFGLDRLVMLMRGLESIREVIAFPKTSTGSSLMDNCPAPVSAAQLKELGIKLG